LVIGMSSRSWQTSAAGALLCALAALSLWGCGPTEAGGGAASGERPAASRQPPAFLPELPAASRQPPAFLPESPAASRQPPAGSGAVSTVSVTAAGLEVLPLPGAAARERTAAGPAFVDVSVEAGVVHRHQKGVFDSKVSNIMPWVASIGAAAAVSDYDKDGDLDLYVTSTRNGTRNALYRNEGGNDGSLRFREVAAQAGVADVNGPGGVSMDAAFADLDNDGDDDLYIVKWGANQLFRNNADGTFSDVTAEAGVGDRSNGNCVLPFDYDGDGLLDLYVCNYFPPVDLQRLETTRIMHDSFEAARNGGKNVLYRNRGGLKFEEVAHSLQLDDGGWSLDAAISDADNDGDVDLYIANDFGQDKFYLNGGGGSFTDFTAQAIGHETYKGMNVDFGDFNGDGFTDAYVANITTAEYLREGNFLWLNSGDGTFTNVSATTGTYDGGWGWCGRFFDYDNDGDLDILTVNGFVSAGAEAYWESLANVAVNPAFRPEDATQWPPMGSSSLSGHEPARLFRNKGDGAFEEAAAAEGIADRRDGRGIALADFDADGDLDVYIANQDAPGALYRNDAGARGSFLLVSLAGTRSNRNAVGARVQVTASLPGGAEPHRLTREVNGVNGYASQASFSLHFGLGAAARVERLTVFWPSGVVQDFHGLDVNRHYRITERGEPLGAEARAELYFARARMRGGPAVEEKASPAVLLELEDALRRKPRNAKLANRYRSECVEHGYFERSLDFFRALIRDHGPMPALRLQLAVALVDKIPALKGDAMAQASTAKECLRELAEVQQRYPRSYAVHYLAGMNHLYWPAGFQHFDRAVRHFEVALEIQAERSRAGRVPEDYHADVLCALGDAHVKGAIRASKEPEERARRFAEARRVWKEGLAAFPQHGVLPQRLALDEKSLVEVVTDERGLEKRINTNLEMLLEENGLAEAEAEVRKGRPDRRLLNTYRLEAYEVAASSRAAAFLLDLLRKEPQLHEVQVHLALALADQCLDAPSGQEADERRAQVFAALERASQGMPDDWLPPYLAGRFHLRRSEDEAGRGAALAALERSAALARRGGSLRVPYPALLLGDALVLAGDEAKALEVWKEAAARWPSQKSLKARHECAPQARAALVRADREREAARAVDLEALADREAELLAFEAALRQVPSREVADRYRQAALDAGEVERAVQFLRGLVNERPRSVVLRLELALALIDRCPDPELGSVRRGLLSSEALEVLDEALKAHPDAWGLHYLRGLIHLNWFTKLKHVPQALESFQRCLVLQQRDGKEKEKANPYHALAYQAMGDCYVKLRQFGEGRLKHWKPGSELFPEDPGLQDRIDLTGNMVDDFVEERRSWDSRQDTWLLSTLVGDLADF
jgi:tetratricopeptide (TPR) repeat protein